MNNRRLSFIREHVKGKKVLDVGCVDHEARRADAEDGDQWLHRIICSEASETIGLDFAENEVAKLNEQGFKIVCGDAETASLDDTFDCVIAGELIEHLSNPGLFISNMYRHLNPGGTIVLTTPNPFYPKRLFEILTSGKVIVNPQHTAWYCPETITRLIERAGFVDIVVEPFNNSEAWFGVGRIPSLLRDWFATNLLIYAKRPNADR